MFAFQKSSLVGAGRLVSTAMFLTLAGLAFTQIPLIDGDPSTPEVDGDSMNAFAFAGSGSMNQVPVLGQPFPSAQQYSVPSGLAKIWDAQTFAPLKGDIAANDVLLVSFWWRWLGPVPEDSAMMVTVMQANSPFKVIAQRKMYQGSGEWKQFNFPMKSGSNYPSGTMVLKFSLGYKGQQMEVAGAQVFNYKTTTTTSALPFTASWGGRRADAPWRAMAEAGINANRKGNLKVNVVDSNGNPVEGAKVRMKMTRNAFDFGTAVTSSLINWNKPHSPKYRSELLRLFNTATPDRELHWLQWDWKNSVGITMTTWLKNNGLKVRGHALIWPKFGYVSWRGGYVMPKDIELLSNDELRGRIDWHFRDETTKLGTLIDEWDVLNEPYLNFDVQGRVGGATGTPQSDGRLGNYEMVRWFNTAKQHAPHAPLYLNDTNMVEQDGIVTRTIDYIYVLCQYLLSNNAPVNGVGFQCHFRPDNVTSLDVAWNQFQRYAALNLRQKVTEFDFTCQSEDDQAEYLKDFMTLAYAQPKMDGFIHWGFFGPVMWNKTAGLFRDDWSKKPAALVWEDLVLNKWYTDKFGFTEVDGSVLMRGYTGKYQVITTVGTATYTQNIDLGNAGSEITVTVNP
jgi:GH35 family endo-1,4-beta-xylanase